MTFTERRIDNRRQNNSKWILYGIIGVIFLSLLFVYQSIASIGSTLVSSGTYTLDKWTTVSTLDTSLDLDIPEWKYKLWVKYFAPEIKNLQAGGYTVEKTMELREVFTKVLVKPVYTDLTITILPGWNSYDIDDYLYRKDIIQDPGDFLLALRDNFSKYQKDYSFLNGVPSIEGFLYPDTYRIPKDATADTVIRKLLSTFDARIGDSYAKLGEKWYVNLILASIVEREERNSSEKPIVAGVLAKRVTEGIPMGADATVCFGYAKTQKQCTPSFIASVIALKHPYNTRNKQGYPPTPISNISLDTWNAVLKKENSPYYYYLHDSEGKIHYATTLEEHNQNKAKYLQ